VVHLHDDRALHSHVLVGPTQSNRSAIIIILHYAITQQDSKKVAGSSCSITERMVPELIPVLGSQPAGDVSHKPGGRLPLLSAQGCSY